MIGQHAVVAVIPARGGSKGLPRKNIRLIAGKPLIAWSIEQALASRYIDKVIVSTEDEEIAQVARDFGAQIPFLRPAELARDDSPAMDAVLHAINWLKTSNSPGDLMVWAEPTSPLRDSSDFDLALEKLLTTPGAECIVGVARAENCHPDCLVRLGPDDYLNPLFNPDFLVRRRQELEEIYYFEGSLYISWIDALERNKSFFHKRTIAYIVPKLKSFDIDELADFVAVEALLLAKAAGIFSSPEKKVKRRL